MFPVSSASLVGVAAAVAAMPGTLPSQQPAPAAPHGAQNDDRPARGGLAPIKDADSVIAAFSAMSDNLVHARVSKGYRAAIADAVKIAFRERVAVASALVPGPKRTKELALLSEALTLPGVETPDRTEALRNAVDLQCSDGCTALHEVSQRPYLQFGKRAEGEAAARAAEITLLLKTGAGDDGALAAVASCPQTTPQHVDAILRNPNAGPWALAAVVSSPWATSERLTEVLRRDNVGEGVQAAVAGAPQATTAHLSDIVGRASIGEGVLVAVARSPHAKTAHLDAILQHASAGSWALASVGRAARTTTRQLGDIVMRANIADEALIAVAESQKATAGLLRAIVRRPDIGAWVLRAVAHSPLATVDVLDEILHHANAGGQLRATVNAELA